MLRPWHEVFAMISLVFRGTHLIVDFDVQADKVALAVADLVILHAGIPSAPALQLVKKVCDDLPYPIKLIQERHKHG